VWPLLLIEDLLNLDDVLAVGHVDEGLTHIGLTVFVHGHLEEIIAT